MNPIAELLDAYVDWLKFAAELGARAAGKRPAKKLASQEPTKQEDPTSSSSAGGAGKTGRIEAANRDAWAEWIGSREQTTHEGALYFGPRDFGGMTPMEVAELHQNRALQPFPITTPAGSPVDLRGYLKAPATYKEPPIVDLPTKEMLYGLNPGVYRAMPVWYYAPSVQRLFLVVWPIAESGGVAKAGARSVWLKPSRNLNNVMLMALDAYAKERLGSSAGIDDLSAVRFMLNFTGAEPESDDRNVVEKAADRVKDIVTFW